jgi:hypothetical protein
MYHCYHHDDPCICLVLLDESVLGFEVKSCISFVLRACDDLSRKVKGHKRGGFHAAGSMVSALLSESVKSNRGVRQRTLNWLRSLSYLALVSYNSILYGNTEVIPALPCPVLQLS